MKLIECTCGLGTPSEFQFPPHLEVARYLLTPRVTDAGALCPVQITSQVVVLALLLFCCAAPKHHETNRMLEKVIEEFLSQDVYKHDCQEKYLNIRLLEGGESNWERVTLFLPFMFSPSLLLTMVPAIGSHQRCPKRAHWAKQQRN